MPRSSAKAAISGMGSTMPRVLGADPTIRTVLMTAAWYGHIDKPSEVSGVDIFEPQVVGGLLE